MPTKIIQAKNISKSFGELKVLDRVSVAIEQAEVVAITGPSGAGKLHFFSYWVLYRLLMYKEILR